MDSPLLRWVAPLILPALFSPQEVQVLGGHTDWARCVIVAPDGKTVASSGRDGMVRLWDPERGVELHRFEGKSVTSGCF